MPEEATAIDPEDRLRVLEHLKSGQRFIPAAVAGLVVAVVAAVAWAVVTVLTKHQIGWLAIGLGAAVGVVVRWLGRGFEVRFAVLGAALAFFGVFLGNFLTIMGMLSNEMGIPLFDILQKFPYEQMPTLMRETFQPMDLLFYGLATWCGWKFSRRELADDEIRSTLQAMKSER